MTVICVLGIIVAILGIVGGVALIGLGGLFASAGGAFGLLGAFGTAIGAAVLIISLISLLGFAWLWGMKRKGWTLVMVMEVISLAISIASFSGSNLASIVIGLIIIIYLYTKRDLFKAAAAKPG